jgi:hypothetical protein
MGMSPEQAKLAHEMMKSMDEDTLKSMMDMSKSFASASAAPSALGTTQSSVASASASASASAGAGARPDLSSMTEQASKMMQNPEMMKAMGKMMKNMDAKTLESMTQQVGGGAAVLVSSLSLSLSLSLSTHTHTHIHTTDGDEAHAGDGA